MGTGFQTLFLNYECLIFYILTFRVYKSEGYLSPEGIFNKIYRLKYKCVKDTKYKTCNIYVNENIFSIEICGNFSHRRNTEIRGSQSSYLDLESYGSSKESIPLSVVKISL